MFGIFRGREKKPLPEGYSVEVADDMRACARLHAHLRKGDENLPLSGVVSLLGGCFLSWASGRVANDWDFYLPMFREAAMRKQGWVFVQDSDKYPVIVSHGYGHRVVSDGWKVTEKPVVGREQLILLKDDVAENAWADFDYQHCMLGIDSDLDIVSAGLTTIATGTFIKNPDAPRHRDEKKLKKKVKDKPVFGGGTKGRERVEETLSLYKYLLEKAIAEQEDCSCGQKHPAYEGFMKALDLR